MTDKITSFNSPDDFECSFNDFEKTLSSTFFLNVD